MGLLCHRFNDVQRVLQRDRKFIVPHEWVQVVHGRNRHSTMNSVLYWSHRTADLSHSGAFKYCRHHPHVCMRLRSFSIFHVVFFLYAERRPLCAKCLQRLIDLGKAFKLQKFIKRFCRSSVESQHLSTPRIPHKPTASHSPRAPSQPVCKTFRQLQIK